MDGVALYVPFNRGLQPFLHHYLYPQRCGQTLHMRGQCRRPARSFPEGPSAVLRGLGGRRRILRRELISCVQVVQGGQLVPAERLRGSVFRQGRIVMRPQQRLLGFLRQRLQDRAPCRLLLNPLDVYKRQGNEWP